MNKRLDKKYKKESRKNEISVEDSPSSNDNDNSNNKDSMINEKLKKLNISLDEETHLKLKLISVLKGITMNEYLLNALKKELDNDSEIIDNIPRVRKK